MISKQKLFSIFLFLVILFLPAGLKLLFPLSEPQQLPSFYIGLLWIFPILLLSSLKNIYAYLIGMLWAVWYVFGSMNLIAQLYYYGTVRLIDADSAALVYLAFYTIFLLGLVVYERLISPIISKKYFGNRQIDYKFSPTPTLFKIVLLIFPILWLADVVLALGTIPIFSAFSGKDLTNELYSLNYGPLYGYSIVMAFSGLVVIEQILKKSKYRILYWLYLFAIVLLLISTGKRNWLVVFAVAALIYIIRNYRFSLSRIFLVGTLLIGTYWATIIIRQGLSFSKYNSIAGNMLLVGGEYWVFSYLTTYINPGTVPDYNWAASTIAAGTNDLILNLFGLSKTELIGQGSAYALMPIFNSEFGIRTGIIGELFIAYNLAGSLLIFLFGLITALVGEKALNTTSSTYLMFYSMILSLFVISIVNQTTDTTGTLAIFLYVYLLYVLVRFISSILDEISRKPTNFLLPSKE